MKELRVIQRPVDYFEQDKETSLNLFMGYCPQAHPSTAPHPALPYLKGYLREVLPNTNVTIKDLNAITYSYLFSPEQLKKRFSPEEAERIRQSFLAQQDERAYRDIPRFISYHRTLEEVLAKISESHKTKYGLKKESLTLQGNTFTYISEYPAKNRSSVLEAIKIGNRETNFFYGFYNDLVLPFIQDRNYDVVALSIYLPDQIIPTFLLASMIKEQNPNRKIILGGNHLTRFRDVLSQDDELNKKIFELTDAIVVYEGEIPFKEVLKRISKKESFSGIPQVISKVNGKITLDDKLSELPVLDMDRLPRPNFDDVFTDLNNDKFVFWTPKPVISLYTQRGCPYAGGCDFCTIMNGNNKPNTKISRSPEKVVEDMKFYSGRFNTDVFSFGNETLTRDLILGLSAELDKCNLEAIIDGYTRTDQLDSEVIEKAKKYFRFLQIGVESSDQETLDSMHKGRKSESDSDLIKTMFDNRIIPHVFLLVGFPPDKIKYQGKARNDYVNFYVKSGLSTLKWLMKNKQNIGTYKTTVLRIPRDDKKMSSKTKDGLVISPKYDHEIGLQEAGDFEFNIPYEKINGSSELDERIAELIDLEKTPYSDYTHNTIYHQRLFNWKDGINWSISQQREKRILRRIWAECVGKEYLEAVKELNKKSGLNKEKRKSLEEKIARIKEENIIALKFPDCLDHISDLISIV